MCSPQLVAQTGRSVLLVHFGTTTKVSTRINRPQEGGGVVGSGTFSVSTATAGTSRPTTGSAGIGKTKIGGGGPPLCLHRHAHSADHHPRPCGPAPRRDCCNQRPHHQEDLGSMVAFALPSPATHATVAATLGTWRKWSSRVWCCRSKEILRVCRSSTQPSIIKRKRHAASKKVSAKKRKALLGEGERKEEEQLRTKRARTAKHTCKTQKKNTQCMDIRPSL